MMVEKSSAVLATHHHNYLGSQSNPTFIGRDGVKNPGMTQ
jgi:hypothetical protein